MGNALRHFGPGDGGGAERVPTADVLRASVSSPDATNRVFDASAWRTGAGYGL
jgi:hypothetical protein